MCARINYFGRSCVQHGFTSSHSLAYWQLDSCSSWIHPWQPRTRFVDTSANYANRDGPRILDLHSHINISTQPVKLLAWRTCPYTLCTLYTVPKLDYKPDSVTLCILDVRCTIRTTYNTINLFLTLVCTYGMILILIVADRSQGLNACTKLKSTTPLFITGS